MNHFSYEKTEIMPISVPGDDLRVICKRDDRFLGGYGGSKARMLKYILFPIKEEGIDLILTAGGPCSNFNRALSVYCAEMHIRLRIVSYTDQKEQYDTSLNYHITRLMNVEYVFCDKKDVSDVLDREKEKLEKGKCKYIFIYGGAEGNVDGMEAYFDAVRELKGQIDDISHIFLPCGTGTTTTGICAGAQAFFPHAKVHAISVARKWEVEKVVLENNIRLLNLRKKSNYSFDNLVFHDQYLEGGYAHHSVDIARTIEEVAASSGMILDPIYSGKAFWGMVKELREIEENEREKVLFWNTGGLINFLSSIK